MPHFLSSRELKVMLGDGAAVTVVDVRPRAQYAEKHVPGAVSVPALDDFAGTLGRAAGGTDGAVILYAEHEGEDAMLKDLAGQAEALGYADVGYLLGGIMAWMEAGGSVESGQES